LFLVHEQLASVIAWWHPTILVELGLNAEERRIREAEEKWEIEECLNSYHDEGAL